MHDLASPPGSSAAPTFDALAQHRVELTAFCYRMLASPADADDAVQETLVRAWKSLDGFEGRASPRTWLHRIATNVCLDMLARSKRRGRPIEVGDAGRPVLPMPEPWSAESWVVPVPDAMVIDARAPDVMAQRQSVRLALVAALQHLPPKQRAVLLLREVVGLSAEECAAMLDTTVASVNSALQRARATLDAKRPAETTAYAPLDEAQRALLARYVEAFERYDLDAFTALLHEEGTLSMPPFPLWLQGRAHIRTWLAGPGIHCAGSRLVPTVANGLPAFGQYRRSPEGGFHAWALQVLELRDGQVWGFNAFLDTAALFPRFGLPMALGAEG